MNPELHILAFGIIADIAGKSAWTVRDILSTDALKTALEQEFPELRSRKYRFAVNQNIIAENTLLQNGDTIALLPPFSGG